MKTTKNTVLEPELFVNSAHGIYIPQIFAETITEKIKKQIKPDVLRDLLDGPDNESYWDAWDSILNMEFKYNGQKLFIIQSEDVWIVPACYLRTKKGQEFVNAY